MPHPSLSSSLSAAVLLLGSLVCGAPLAAQSLHGSPRSVKRSYHYARAHDLRFTRSSRDVREALRHGRLVRLTGNKDYVLHEVSFPYVVPTARTFVQRLSAEYRDACGESLVVTSAVRPESAQPANSSPLSVHPAGIAIDLRRPARRSCLTWLRHTLLTLERAGVLDATEEHHPAHFHVAIYAAPYREYLAAR